MAAVALTIAEVRPTVVADALTIVVIMVVAAASMIATAEGTGECHSA